MKRLFKVITLSLIVLFIFVSCTADTGNSNGLKTIKLSEVVRSIFYAPMYSAISQGYFEEEGIKIDLTTSQGADKTVQEVLSGNSEIGFCGPEQLVYLYNQGRDDPGIMFAQLTKKDGSFLVSRNSSSLNWNELKGKTLIGGRPGGVPEMTLEHLLKKKGINPNKDVDIITNLAFNATTGAFKSGTGDYIACFEPTGSLLEKESSGKVVASIGEEVGEIAYTAFFTTNEYLNNNKETIQKFTNAIYKGQLWINKTPSKDIAESIKEFFPGSNVNDLSKMIDRYKEIDAFNKTPNVSSDGLNNLFNIIEGYNKELIQKRPPIDKISTNEFSNKAVETIK